MLFKRTAIASALLALCGCASAATLNPNDKSALGAATHKAAANLVSMYETQTQQRKTAEGAFDQSETSWFVSGMCWWAVFDNSAVNGDKSSDGTAGSAISEASFNQVGDLLGGSLKTLQEKFRGKWNDDIAWWALAMMAAVDAHGKDAQIPNGAKFLDVATLTWNQIIEQWDPTTCNGGIYWSRDRDDANRKNYKSSITHGQFVQLSARLAIATGNTTYLEWSDRAYNWMKQANLITQDFHVLDGAQAPTCTEITRAEWSYNIGTFLGGLGLMYKATNKQAYIDDAKAMLNTATTVFTQNNILYEPICKRSQCGRDQPAFLPQLAKGLSILHAETPDAAMKQQIATIIDTTLQSAVKNCNDDWWCNKEWTASAQPAQNVYDQYPTLELLVAASRIHGATPPAGTTKDTLPAGSSSSPTSQNGQNGKANSGAASNMGWGAAAAVAGVALGLGLQL